MSELTKTTKGCGGDHDSLLKKGGGRRYQEKKQLMIVEKSLTKGKTEAKDGTTPLFEKINHAE